MYLFYKALPESAVGSNNSLMSIDSCVFSNGVSTWVEESSGLSVYIYDGLQYEFDVSKCSTQLPLNRRFCIYLTWSLQKMLVEVSALKYIWDTLILNIKWLLRIVGFRETYVQLEVA